MSSDSPPGHLCTQPAWSPPVTVSSYDNIHGLRGARPRLRSSAGTEAPDALESLRGICFASTTFLC